MLNLDFKKLMTARFLFTFSVQIQAVVLGWHMYALTKNPLYLGLIGLAEAVPAIGLALYAGYIVDRSRPLQVYRRVIEISFLSGLLMLISQRSEFGLSVHAQVVALFCSSFLTGLGRSFSQPVVFATVPRLVKRENLPRASAWMSSAMQIARISGPALGGLLYGWVDVSGAAIFVCLGLFLSRVAASLIEVQLDAPPKPTEKKSFSHELFVGARFVFKHPILLPALSLDMVSVFFGGVTALLPIYAAEILAVGPTGLGLLRAAPAVGATMMSLWIANKNLRAKAGGMFFGAVTGFGLCILVFAVSRDVMLSGFALILSGAFDSVSMVVRTAAVQLSSPDSMRGRISAVNSIFIGSSNELGEFESGIAAHFLGTMPAAIFGGVVCLASVAIVAFKSKALRQLDFDQIKKTTA